MKPHLPILAAFLVLLPLQISHAQSQMQMNQEAGQALEQADTKLNTVYKNIMASKDVDAEAKKNLRVAQRVWLQFVEAQVKSHYPLKEGENPQELYGSIYPMEVAGLKTKMVKRRIQQLEELLPSLSDNGTSMGISKKQALKNLKKARVAQQAAYNRLLKFHEGDPGMESVVQQAQTAWEQYKKAQLISQFPLREEEEKMPESIYGATYYADHAEAEIKLIRQRIDVLTEM